LVQYLHWFAIHSNTSLSRQTDSRGLNLIGAGNFLTGQLIYLNKVDFPKETFSNTAGRRKRPSICITKLDNVLKIYRYENEILPFV